MPLSSLHHASATCPPPLQIREQELALLKRSHVIKTLNLCLVFAVPPLIALVIYATYAFK